MPPALFPALLRDDSGSTATEYALIAALIAVAGASAFVGLGNELGTTYDQIGTEVAAAND